MKVVYNPGSRLGALVHYNQHPDPNSMERINPANKDTAFLQFEEWGARQQLAVSS
ncbi:hypothetical protein HOM50_04990 [bacterium]|jgi:hypothetical protein|nr:hypothetical protein [bacterium]MBT5015737.1 hypothetical protein [bacterium]